MTCLVLALWGGFCLPPAFGSTEHAASAVWSHWPKPVLCQTHALVMTRLGMLCRPPSQCHADVTDLDEIWLGRKRLARLGRAALKLHHNSSPALCCFVFEGIYYTAGYRTFKEVTDNTTQATVFVMEILDMPLQIVRFSCSFQTDNLCLHSFECLGSWANISLFSNAHAVLTKK